MAIRGELTVFTSIESKVTPIHVYVYTSSQQKTIYMYERDAGMCTLINQSINTCKGDCVHGV